MNRSTSRLAFRLALLTTVAGLASPAFSQSLDSATDDQVARLDEIVVTAERRSVNVQDAPLAVTAIGAEAIAKQGAAEFSDLESLMPSTEVRTASGAYVYLEVRGVSQKFLNPGDEVPVGTYVDGGYIARAYGLASMLYDLNRIEVLPGPQGTLYGRNTSGGAVNVITNHPTQDYEGAVEVEYGNYDRLRLFGMVNLPINDELAVRIAAQRYTRDGYFNTGVSDADQLGARLSLQWNRGRSRLYMSADYAESGGNGPGENYIPGTTNVPDIWDNDAIYTPAFVERAKVDVTQWSLLANWDYDLDWATFTAIGVYRDASNTSANNTGDAGFVKYNSQSTMTSLEFRLASNESEVLTWQVGAYLFKEDWPLADNFLYNAGFARALTGVPTIDPTNPNARGLYVNWPDNNTEAYAFYGQATWSPTPRLHLTAGLRYSYDKKEWPGAYTSIGLRPNYTVTLVGGFGPFSNAPRCVAGNGQPSVIGVTSCPPQSDEWDNVDYRLSASFDLTENSMIYASTSTGYKAGGMYFGPISTYGPETVTSYEIGSKNSFFDRSLNLNITGYSFVYEDFFSSYNDAGSGLPFANNIGDYEARGVTVAALWAPTQADLLSLDIDWYDSEISELNYPTTPVPTSRLVLGASLPGNPEWRVSAAYERTIDFAGGVLTPRIQTSWQSDNQWTFLTTTVTDPSHFRTDVSLRYEPPSGRWNVTVFAKNLEDSATVTNAIASALIPGAYYGTFEDPRTYGVRLGANF